jgi:hypothetical protein
MPSLHIANKDFDQEKSLNLVRWTILQGHSYRNTVIIIIVIIEVICSKMSLLICLKLLIILIKTI